MDGKNIQLTSCAYGMTCTLRVGRRKFYTLTLVARKLIVYVGRFGETFVGSSSTIELQITFLSILVPSMQHEMCLHSLVATIDSKLGCFKINL
jgi:hypothetical protein